MKMFFLQLFIFLLINIHSLDISQFHINYFQQNSKLYYVNAMNNIKGNIYFEFWGENDSKRYFVGINYLSEEYIIFNNDKIYFSIEANTISSFHESIIVNDNENDNDANISILSMNADNFDFINFDNKLFGTKSTKNYAFQNEGDPSHRNSLIKIKNSNQYLASLIMKKIGHYPWSFFLAIIYHFQQH